MASMKAMDEEDKEVDEVQNCSHQNDMQEGVKCINFLCLKFIKNTYVYFFRKTGRDPEGDSKNNA